jgi:hypothetical protein
MEQGAQRYRRCRLSGMRRREKPNQGWHQSTRCRVAQAVGQGGLGFEGFLFDQETRLHDVSLLDEYLPPRRYSVAQSGGSGWKTARLT